MSSPSGPAVLDEGASFEDILARLHDVVERLEEGELPLEQSLQMFEEGIRLSRLGQRRLDEAESRVERLLAERDSVTTEPLESPLDSDHKEPE